MAVRQYVGARYVPQIMGDWNDQTVYEPLSIVHYNFASYTSKKAVPAGVKPTNDEYWALSSQDSVQVEEYRQEVEDNTAIATEIKNNQHKYIAGPQLKRFVLIGDSYLTGYIPGGGGINYGVIAAEIMGLAPDSGLYFLRGVGGSGFAPTGNYGPYLSQLESAIGASTNLGVNELITDVLFVGGLNENKTVSGLKEVEAAMSTCIRTAKQAYPNARITVGFLGFGNGRLDTGGLTDIMSVYTKCTKYGASFLYMNSPILYTNVWSDNTHPNQEGYNRIGAALASYLLNGRYTYIANGAITVVQRNYFQVIKGEHETVMYGNLDINNYVNSSTPVLTIPNCPILGIPWLYTVTNDGKQAQFGMDKRGNLYVKGASGDTLSNDFYIMIHAVIPDIYNGYNSVN